MPRRKSSIKRQRVDKKKHLKNLRVKTRLKRSLKKFQALLSAKKIDEAKKFLTEVFSQFDKAAKKKIVHPKTANRRKSRLSRRLSKTT